VVSGHDDAPASGHADAASNPNVGSRLDRLWTPWRLGYVGGEKPAGCIFCIKPAENRDANNLILARGERAFVLLNLYPYNSGHLMVVPYEHTSDFATLPAEIGAELFALTQRSLAALTAEYGPQGFNVGLNLGEVAGGSVSAHLHLHVVPRWGGDTNFMPVTADTKVLPETLDQTYRRLLPYFTSPPLPRQGDDVGEADSRAAQRAGGEG
jgi:ATP adenylyltransferase